ncbi:hypothetical protein [Alkalimarinus alittae]|uniref:Uncharacterized protein n=1 Tax=Alkalimarinus alittae TaxID=2961619 RepID=A0ABY6MZS4_9ALTE|nr:hypothetical protein [Alkalimarinus alittae]UZE95339.1 hypothetical protein NKI27_14885 [Alkalimarinus alittae]
MAKDLESQVTQQQAEAAEQESQTNLKYLLANVLKKSKSLEDSYGDFSPYGAALFRDGSVKYVWYAKPGQVAKNPDKIIPLIWQTLNSQVNTGQIAGVAVAYKFKKINDEKMYLGVELEYQTGFAESFAAEILNGPDNKLEWGNSNVARAEPKLFTLKEMGESADLPLSK